MFLKDRRPVYRSLSEPSWAEILWKSVTTIISTTIIGTILSCLDAVLIMFMLRIMHHEYSYVPAFSFWFCFALCVIASVLFRQSTNNK